MLAPVRARRPAWSRALPRTVRQFTIGHCRHRLVTVEIIDSGPGMPPGCGKPSSIQWSAGVPTAQDGAWLLPRTSSVSTRQSSARAILATPRILDLPAAGTEYPLNEPPSETVWLLMTIAPSGSGKSAATGRQATQSFDSADGVISRLSHHQP
jgi:hypothetical protein